MSRLLEAEFEQEYLDELRREHGYLELLGIPDYRQHRLPIDLGYVSLSLAGDSDVAPARRAEIVLAEHRCLIVQGEAGAGKTTLMQWEAAHCRERKVLKKSRRSQLALASDSYRVNTLEGELVPFFIRLRNLSSPTDGRPPSAFPKKGDWLSMSVPDPSDGRAFVAPKGWLGRVLQEGRALVLFDGLDELRPEDREGFWRGLQALLEEHPGTHIRVTSRYFSREDERSRQWNPPSDPVTNKPVPVVEVQPLSPDGVDKLIDLWYEAAVQESIDPADRTRLKKEMEDYARLLKTTLREERYRRIYELARTPFLCAAICLINRNRRQLLPEARHELFRMLVVALLALRDKQRRVPIPEEFKNLSEVELVRIHSQLALDMMRGMERSGDEPADYMIKASRAQVLQWLQSYIRDLPSIDHTVRAEDLLDNFLVPRCGMLRTPEYGAYDFRHRALQEYLAGGQALQHNVKELANHADDDRWHDTIVMSVGGYNVGEAQATCLVKELIARGEREGIISLIASCWR